MTNLRPRVRPRLRPRVRAAPENEVAINGWVLAYSATIALVTAFLFGFIPALRLTAQEAGDALRSGSCGNAVGGRGGHLTNSGRYLGRNG